MACVHTISRAEFLNEAQSHGRRLEEIIGEPPDRRECWGGRLEGREATGRDRGTFIFANNQRKLQTVKKTPWCVETWPDINARGCVMKVRQRGGEKE